ISLPQRGICVAVMQTRKVVMELCHHARKAPSLPLSRRLNRGELVELRRQAADDGTPTSPPSWIAIFMKAYALVARRHPELRRALIGWPYQHFYEHPISEATVLVEREIGGETVVLGAKIREPGALALGDIDLALHPI